MRKFLLVALALLVSGSIAMAQDKVDTNWHCSKAAAEQKLDVGDAPDHSYWIGQGTRDSTSSSGELKEKSGEYTEFHDAWKASFNFHGYFNATTGNGDKVYYTYEGSASTDIAKPAANKMEDCERYRETRRHQGFWELRRKSQCGRLRRLGVHWHVFDGHGQVGPRSKRKPSAVGPLAARGYDAKTFVFTPMARPHPIWAPPICEDGVDGGCGARGINSPLVKSPVAVEKVHFPENSGDLGE